MPAEHPMVMDAAEHWYRPDPVGAMISVGSPSPARRATRNRPGAVERLDRDRPAAHGTAHRRVVEGVDRTADGTRVRRPCAAGTPRPRACLARRTGGYGLPTSAAMATAAAEQVVAGMWGAGSPRTVGRCSRSVPREPGGSAHGRAPGQARAVRGEQAAHRTPRPFVSPRSPRQRRGARRLTTPTSSTPPATVVPSVAARHRPRTGRRSCRGAWSPCGSGTIP
ncbi:hypothetical protein QJS66_07305 [Kocuria rhizophila]|nr:hypothetical protein QJS66_07305 [Kocuria rhizophila]